MNPRRHNVISLVLLLLATALISGYFARTQFLRISGASLPAIAETRGFQRGMLFDLAVGIYFSLPLALLGLFSPNFWRRTYFQRLSFGVFFVAFFLIGFATIAERFFVDEFHSRFNFIAVDYLVYTNEVINNLWESYPLWWILPAIALGFFLISLLLLKFLRFLWQPSYPASLAFSAIVLSGAIACGWKLEESKVLDQLESAEIELTKNPVHALFAAYLHNEIDYRRFYPVLSDGTPKKSPAIYVKSEDPTKKLNVVLILMESMSAKFMRKFNPDGPEITPHLDRLAKEGLFYNRLYSTGSRTVRGIEAVMLSLPPTPGQSIVRRPEGTGLFNMGTVFRGEGYQTQFLYGGNAVFDNMGAFFAGNGFEVLDKGAMNEVVFSNAWGASDEDIFNMSLQEADKSSAARKPFFQFILTTSNHRPYTFPEGRIDLPSKTSGREGAVKYADFAIGKFIADAKEKPWFRDTVFVIVADHNASVSGGHNIIPADYHIPLLFYSPAHIQPAESAVLASQIDVAPTLFGILGFSYESKFFGHDLRTALEERVFLATYQKIALWQNSRLTVLSPGPRIEVSSMQGDQVLNRLALPWPIANDFTSNEVASDLRDTIRYYETASELFRSKALKEINSNEVAQEN